MAQPITINRNHTTNQSLQLSLLESVDDILCMRNSHVYYSSPENEQWDCCKYLKVLEVPFTCLLEGFEKVKLFHEQYFKFHLI